jgi:hypothetical protein
MRNSSYSAEAGADDLEPYGDLQLGASSVSFGAELAGRVPPEARWHVGQRRKAQGRRWRQRREIWSPSEFESILSKHPS